MQVRAVILLLLAITLGVAAVYVMNQYLAREVASLSRANTVETVPIVVAAETMIPGTRVDKSLLKVAQFPKDNLPEGYFSAVNLVLGNNPEHSPIVLREVRKGEPILQYILSGYGAGGGLPTAIPEDMRAISITVNEVRGVSGFALPGDYVDVLHTTSAGRSDEKLVTRMVLQNVKILAVDQISSVSQAEPVIVNAITLLVTPFDAQRLALAQKLGELSLILRNEFDASLIEAEVATYKELLTEEKERKTTVYKRVRRPRIEIIRGLEVTNKTVDEAAPGSPAQ